MTRSTFVLSCLACLVVGYLVASVPGFDPVNPFHPQRDRPVARFLAKIAKLGLWVAVFAEPMPQRTYAAQNGEDSMICHAEGW